MIAKIDLGRSALVHYRSEFLPITETFIYQYLKNFRRVVPLVVCQYRRCNAAFPYSRVLPLRSNDIASRGFAWIERRFLLGNLSEREAWYEQSSQLLSNSLEKLRPLVVHAHFGTDAVHALDAKEWLDFRLITTFYGGWDTSRRPVLEQLDRHYRRLWRLGDRFLVEGTAMGQQLERLGCPPEKIRIQRIAVDLEQLPFCTPKLPVPTLRIFVAGRFVELKGIDIAIRAFGLIAREHPNAELYVVGSGELGKTLKHERRQSGAAHRIHFLGMLSYSEYLAALRRSHIFLCASRTAHDGDSEGGAPTCLLEAQAMGIPVVATRHADIPNIVPDVVAERLVPEGNHVLLAEALSRLIAGSATWEKVTRVSRKFVEEWHNIRRETPRLEDHYKNLVLSIGKRTA